MFRTKFSSDSQSGDLHEMVGSIRLRACGNCFVVRADRRVVGTSRDSAPFSIIDLILELRTDCD